MSLRDTHPLFPVQDRPTGQPNKADEISKVEASEAIKKKKIQRILIFDTIKKEKERKHQSVVIS